MSKEIWSDFADKFRQEVNRRLSFNSRISYLGSDGLWHVTITVDGKEYDFAYKTNEEAAFVEARWFREFGLSDE